jgi:hypothetical protein
VGSIVYITIDLMRAAPGRRRVTTTVGAWFQPGRVLRTGDAELCIAENASPSD